VIEIRNLQFQPLTFNLAENRTLHLGPRERRIFPENDITHEIRLAEKRRLVSISKQKVSAKTTKRRK